MKRILLAAVLTGSLLLLSACDAPCTEEVLQDKLEEVSAKMQKIVESGDMGKLMSIAAYSQKLNKLRDVNKDNLEPACEAVDELLAELDNL